MPQYQQDLFLLMVNLIQYRDKEEVLRIFREALADMIPEVDIQFYELGDDSHANSQNFEICTANSSYGYMNIKGNLENEMVEHLRNATQMLGWILENIDQQELLDNKKALLENEVQDKTKELQQAEYKYRQMFERSVDGIMLTDMETGYVIEANPMMCTLLGRAYDDIIGRHHSEFHAPEYQDTVQEIFTVYNHQKTDDAPWGPEETIFIRPDGSRIATEVRTQFINEGEDEVLAGFFRDITKRKENEEKVRESESRLSTLMANLPGMVYQCYNDRYWTMLFLNQGCLTLTGYEPETIQNNSKLSYGDLIVPEDRSYVWESVQYYLNNKKPFTITYRIKTKDGQIKWVWERGRYVKTDDEGNEILEGFISDITQQKQAEQAIKNSLEEKKTLLKEIHHRVKNNLNIITSLLRLQSATLPSDSEAQKPLDETYNQIHSMAQVHEQLYQSHDFNSVDMNNYIESLINSLSQSYTKMGKVDFQLKVDHVAIDINRAIPCGLIINELVTNSIKHAFKDNVKGKIRINLTKSDDGNLILKVEDNGAGLPQDFDIKKANSLGLELVNMLIKQLNADIRVHNKNGASFEITAPLNISKENYEK